MRFEAFSFGSIRIDGITYEHDVIIDRGQIRKRKKKPSKKVSRRILAHSVVVGRRDSLEVPTPGHRHWRRSIAGNGGCEARGQAAENRIIDPANRRGYRAAQTKA